MDWLIIILAGFSAGVLNAIAGGGSFITLPALTFVGINPIMANATGTAALLPGYIASTWRFRKDIKALPSLSYLMLFVLALIGGAGGALLLIIGDETVFSALIPWLILTATLLFLFKHKITTFTQSSLKVFEPISTAKATFTAKSTVVSSLIILSICVYGGYFNGGIGVILLAAFSLLGMRDLIAMNGLKTLLSAVLTSIAVIIYIIGGQIDWLTMLIMAISSSLGGYFGASISYKIEDKWIVATIITTGFVSFIYFL